ncbi:MAG: Type I restriction enzyme EcoR124II R protein [candidate division WS2 bacterium]|uniref:Type I restriction enzyme endonuclease subunit n=1 Tax=Psychracetigena formicireducens TaxID=2986056 RepID=A0A9E2BHH8_PSYF1|nr:Type I restriction enzyme EcoR124II R protein [Candidatus Psychracetigena formicireducens]
MTPRDSKYTEETLVERPAMELFNQLGWSIQYCFHEFDENGKSYLGRETKADVVLISRLKPMLQKINSDLPEVAIDEAIKVLTQDRSVMGMVSANREVYDLLKNGALVSFMNDKKEQVGVRVNLIGWDNIDSNDFFLASQVWISGDMYTRRADLVGFVNGIPLIFIELKASHRNLKKAYDENLRDYKSTIPQVFWFNGLIILSNGSRSITGTISSEWEHFSEWKKINSEGEQGIVSLETVIRAVCDKERLLDILENYTLFRDEKNGPIKIVAKNHQYLGVENAISAFHKIYDNQGRLGVFWHTQGAGKTESMFFFSQKILRKIPGNWTFVIVTDRNELDDQTYKRFVRAGAIKGKQERAETSEELRQLLREDHRYVFTTIQKFRTEKGTKHPVISERSSIIVMTDEAHRTQYDIFAMNMRNALPNANFIGFTGTPLMVGEEKTKEVFGDYVSIYNFRQSVDDKATVPLFYENRKPKVQLVNLSLNEDIQRILEDAEFDDVEQRKFEREFSKEYQLITREDRLEDIAQDIVLHFMNRGFRGKAMVVSIDKATAVKMYDKVKKYWNRYADKLHEEYKDATDVIKEELGNNLIYMKQTDMAVVVSPSQNEIEDLKAKGADIIPHRRRINNEDLDEKFKDPDDPLRIVFVCAMWMTGFDVPSCSTIYLDKPMKNHTLMQTIARVNRVFGEHKVAGLIVDYIGVLHNLNKALAIYAVPLVGGGIDSPVIEKQELIESLRSYIIEIDELCEGWGISLNKIISAKGLECVRFIDDAIESILENDERQAQFSEKNAIIQKTYKAILPDISASEFQPVVGLLHILAEKLGSISPTVDISDVLKKVSEILDKSVKVEKRHIEEKPGKDEYKVGKILDLSKINLERLQEQFNKGCKRISSEQLKKAIEAKLRALYMLNKSRIDYIEKFQKLIDEYNAGSMNVEEYYRRLLEFVKSLDKEEKRALSENLNEEELAVYDLLVNPPFRMTQKDIMAVKKVSHILLEKLKIEKLVLDWRKKQQARASVRLCIEEILEYLPSIFTTEIYHQKCGLIYQHVYESYYGSGISVYSPARI